MSVAAKSQEICDQIARRSPESLSGRALPPLEKHIVRAVYMPGSWYVSQDGEHMPKACESCAAEGAAVERSERAKQANRGQVTDDSMRQRNGRLEAEE